MRTKRLHWKDAHKIRDWTGVQDRRSGVAEADVAGVEEIILEGCSQGIDLAI